MIREIKFRIWDKEYEEFIQFNKMGFLEDGSLWYVQGVDENEKEIDPPYFEDQNDWQLMQYTGLKDNNGVEIYEGDALRDSESIVIVKFADGKFSVDYRTMGGKWRNYGSLFDYLKDYEGEVIGNVYQNKDLLEREAE